MITPIVLNKSTLKRHSLAI